MRPVTLLPSVPASGESLTRNIIASVGGSIGCAGIGVSTDGSQIVIATVAFGSPAMATMSPASASSTGTRSSAAERQHLGDAAALDQLAVVVEHLHRLVGFGRPGSDAAGDEAAEIGVGFEDGAEQAERPFFHHRRLDVAEDEIEQRLHAVVVRAFEAGRHPALLGRAVEDREIELLVAGVERGEQVEHFVDDFDRPGVGAVHLVDDDDGLEPHLERLGDHELGLRQRTFGGVHQHQRAVDHVEDALHLAAEIGVAGRVDDVDTGALPDHRGRLGQDSDAAFALEVVGIHGALDHALVLAVGAGLLQQPVDQRGFAVVDVGDDGDVAEIHEVPKTKARARFEARDASYCGAI